MTGDTHYDLEVLAELAEDLLDTATARRVRAHLAVCAPCGERLADLAAVREVFAATPTPAMPMGVALRIDRALAAEAERRTGGVGLAEAPDWDELMRDAPWETAAAARPVPPVEEPAPPRLGVVADDGTVTSAKTPAGPSTGPSTRTRRRARTAPGIRRWAMPAAAASVAAAVIGATAMSTVLFSSPGAEGPGREPVIAFAPTPTPYTLIDSGYNYSDGELKGPLVDYFAPAGPIVSRAVPENQKLKQCIDKVTARAGMPPFAVDQGQYNGKDATIMAFRKNGAANDMRVYVVGPECEQLRKPVLATWE